MTVYHPCSAVTATRSPAATVRGVSHIRRAAVLGTACAADETDEKLSPGCFIILSSRQSSDHPADYNSPDWGSLSRLLELNGERRWHAQFLLLLFFCLFFKNCPLPHIFWSAKTTQLQPTRVSSICRISPGLSPACCTVAALTGADSQLTSTWRTRSGESTATFLCPATCRGLILKIWRKKSKKKKKNQLFNVFTHQE